MILRYTNRLLKEVNEIFAKANHDTGACCGKSKCAEIAFKRGEILMVEGLQLLKEMMPTLDPDHHKRYKFM